MRTRRTPVPAALAASALSLVLAACGSFENPSLPFPWSCKVDYPRHLLVLSEKDYVGQLLDAWLAFRRMTFNVTVSFTYKGRDIFG